MFVLFYTLGTPIYVPASLSSCTPSTVIICPKWISFYSDAANLSIKQIFFMLSFIYITIQGVDPEILEKGAALYVSHHGWSGKKILGFSWPKKAEITLETIGFWQNISISIFKFSPFLSIKSYQFLKTY